MSEISHLSMFYETRRAIHVQDSDPTKSPHTELNSVPTKAEIRYEEHENRVVDCEEFEAPNGKGYETAQFLISRAMIAPDAVVVEL